MADPDSSIAAPPPAEQQQPQLIVGAADKETPFGPTAGNAAEGVAAHPRSSNPATHATGVEGLDLHRGVLTAAEQDALVCFVNGMLDKGEAGGLLPNTYRPNTNRAFVKRAQSRDTLQFGNCYTHQNRIYNGEMEPLPPLLTECIRRLTSAGIFTEATQPTTCTVNVYKVGQWLPPHVDNRNFARPFCTVSLCSEQAVVFGSKVEKVGDGMFEGGARIYMPVGSALRVAGEAADTLYHAEFDKGEAGIPMFCNHPRATHKCKSCAISPGGSPPPEPEVPAIAAESGGPAPAPAPAPAAVATTPPTASASASASSSDAEVFDLPVSGSAAVVAEPSSTLREGAHKGPPEWCPGLRVFKQMEVKRNEEHAQRQSHLRGLHAAAAVQAKEAQAVALEHAATVEKTHSVEREANAARDKVALEERVAAFDFGGFSFAGK